MNKLLVGAALAGVVGAGLGVGVASAGSTQDKIHNKDVTEIIDFFNPCTQTVGQVTITFSGLEHALTRANGTFKENANLHGTFETDDGVTGRYVSQHVIAGGDNFVGSDSLHARGVASDGSQFELSFHGHTTVNGQGEVTADFFKGCPPSA
jgi:hypothetical protein